MKKMALGLAMSFAASTAFAGGMDDPVVVPPVMKPEVIEKQAASSSAPSAPTVIALMTLITFGVALGN